MNYRLQSRQITPVNTVLIAMNVIVFILLEIWGSTMNTEYMLHHGATYSVYVLEYHEYWRIFSAMFLHFGIRHLLNNMVILAFVGDNLERAVGKVRFLVIYLMSGAIANLMSCLINEMQHEHVVGAGASGAIFGVVGALAWILIANHGAYEDLNIQRIVLFIVFSIYLGLQNSTTDNIAHIAGLIAGILLSMALYRRDPN